MSETTAPLSGALVGRAVPYDDTLALNDIHAILTSPRLADGIEDVLQAIAVLLARTGRNPHPSRIITAILEEGQHGIPVARIEAEGTIITIGQDPNGPGIRVDIAPRDPADEAALVIAISDKVIRRAHSAGLLPVTGQPGGQS